MTWEAVPWMVDGGAQHSAQVGRLLAYAAFQGNEGILGSGDLKVTQLGTPGGSVQVAAGACSILNRNTSYPYQAYACRNPTPDTVAIAANATGAMRSDLVIARIEDPNLTGDGWSVPGGGMAGGPFIYTRVISGVPATTRSVAELGLGYTALALARVDVPASTSTILNSHITDLRAFGNPRTRRFLTTITPGAATPISATSMANWLGTATLTIPPWATQAVISCVVAAARVDRFSTTVNGTTAGAIRAMLDHASLADLFTQESGYDADVPFAATSNRYTLAVGDTVQIPAANRGLVHTFRLQGRKNASGPNVNMMVDSVSSVIMDIEFQELPG